MADIIELLERRDEKALELLRFYYGDYCRAILLRLLGSREETEEALSDVWLQIWNAIPPARPRHLKAYLPKPPETPPSTGSVGTKLPCEAERPSFLTSWRIVCRTKAGRTGSRQTPSGMP